MVQRRLALVAISLVLLAGLSTIVPIGAEQGGGEPVEIGRYRQFGANHDLTQQHISWVGPHLDVKGPIFTTELTVNSTFLRSHLGPWASLQAFSPGHGEINLAGREANFRPLRIGPEPAFTWGDDTQVRFLERPMWVSAEQSGWGENITLHMDDGDSTGQAIYVSRHWLLERGIHRPSAVHEDGGILAVNVTDDKQGFLIHVPHFSYVVLHESELDVRGRQQGVLVPHIGERTWHPSYQKLQVAVGSKVVPYELLIEKEWVTLNIPCSRVLDYLWDFEVIDGKDFFVIPLLPSQTPTNVKITAHLSESIFAPSPAHRGLQVPPGLQTLSWESTSTGGAWAVFLEDSRLRCELEREVPQCQNLSGTLCADVVLVPGQTYYWQVKDLSRSPAALGPIWTFRTDPAYGPLVPAATSPNPEAVVEGPDVLLEWTGGHTYDHAVNYTVILEAWDVSPIAAYPSCTRITQTSCLAQGLSEGTRYSWRVVANDAYSSWSSPTRSFSTTGSPPLHAALIPLGSIEPRPGERTTEDAVLFAWDSVNPSATFDVYLQNLAVALADPQGLDDYVNGTMPPFTEKLCAAVAAACSSGPLDPNTWYRWTVVPASDSPEAYGDFNFTTDAISLSGFELFSPANITLEISPYAYLYWNGPVGPEVQYRTYVKLGSGDWELECLGTAIHCAPRDLELGRLYWWKVEADNAGVVLASAPFSFSVGIPVSQNIKTLLFINGYNSESFSGWRDVRNLVLDTYDRVIPVGYYGGECGIGSTLHQAQTYKHNADADGHKTIKHWRHAANSGKNGDKDESSGACGTRAHWTDTHIEHLAYHLSWYIRRQHTMQGNVVDLVGYSMGGLLVRYTLALLEMDAGEYGQPGNANWEYPTHGRYDRLELPRWCGGWSEPACRIENYSERDGFWPANIAVKDVVTWGTGHKGFHTIPFGQVDIQKAQIMKATPTRFLDWLRDEAQNPQSGSDMVDGTYWSLVFARKHPFRCDVTATVASALGMEDAWTTWRYRDPCYRHSDHPGSSSSQLIYHEDDSRDLDADAVVNVNNVDGEEREALGSNLRNASSGAFPHTGYWLYLVGLHTWNELPGWPDPDPQVRW